MNRAAELKLLERLLDLVDAGACDGGAATDRELTVDRYVCPTRFALERRQVFQQLPVVVGFSSQIRRPGDYLTHVHSGVPVLVLRDENLQLRAFVNACRHRGSTLVEAAGSTKGHIVCPYHGWVYDLQGCLRAVPHRKGFPGLDLERTSLTPLQVAERFGLIFVIPDPNAEEVSIPAFLAGVLGDLESYGLPECLMRLSSSRIRNMNWKLMMDASYECYHFRRVHASTVGPWFFDNVGAFDWNDPHLRMVFPKRSLLKVRERPQGEWRIREHVNSIYGIFPNTVVMVLEDHAMVSTAWPIAVDRTLIASAMLTPHDVPAQAQWADLVRPRTPKSSTTERMDDARWEMREKIYWSAIEEDVAMAERIQTTVGSGANSSLRFGSFEGMIVHCHDAIDRVLAGGGCGVGASPRRAGSKPFAASDQGTVS